MRDLGKLARTLALSSRTSFVPACRMYVQPKVQRAPQQYFNTRDSPVWAGAQVSHSLTRSVPRHSNFTQAVNNSSFSRLGSCITPPVLPGSCNALLPWRYCEDRLEWYTYPGQVVKVPCQEGLKKDKRSVLKVCDVVKIGLSDMNDCNNIDNVEVNRIYCSSVLKKRRRKMNRHKYKKWRKRMRFLRRSLKK